MWGYLGGSLCFCSTDLLKVKMKSLQRILVVIVHYFNPEGDGSLGCLRNDPKGRAKSLARNITSLHDLFNNCTVSLDFRSTYIQRPANTNIRYEVDVKILTTRGMTVLSHLAIDPGLFEVISTDVEPEMLGFEANEIFKDYADDYDRYVFLEDDIIIHDPLFFAKLDWFEKKVGSHALLQPRLYEVTERDGRGKVYIDGDYVPDQVARYRETSGKSKALIEIEQLGQMLRFSYAANPHSGCYFISREQLHFWLEKPWYLDRDTGFVRSFESAASLGILKTFDIYKSELNCAAFLEVQHCGEETLAQVKPSLTNGLSKQTPAGKIKSDSLRLAELEAEVKFLRIELQQYNTTPIWLKNAQLEGEIKHLDGIVRHQSFRNEQLKQQILKQSGAASSHPDQSNDSSMRCQEDEHSLRLKNAQLEGAIKYLDTSLEHRAVQIEQLKNTLDELYQSTSWRVTQPLRYLKQKATKLFKIQG